MFDVDKVKLSTVFDEYVKPAVEADGGRIELVAERDGVVYVRMSGACVGCASKQVTLLGLVERTLIEEVRGVTSVQEIK